VERARFGRTELEVTPVCLGAMNFGTPDWGCDATAAAEIVATFRDGGGNFFDTANIYGLGESERLLGSLLADAREEMVIASKVGFPSPQGGPGGLSPHNLRASLEGTLERLGTSYLDLFQLHAFDVSVPLEETLGALQGLVDEGLVRYAGCSNFFAWQIAHGQTIAQAHGWQGLVSAQMMYSLIRRDIEREHVGYAVETGLALIAYGPLHGGQLAAAWLNADELPSDSRAVQNSDVYLSDAERVFAVTAALVEHSERIGATPGQVALAWVLRNPAIAAALTAARSAAELEEQLRALDLDADDAFWASLDDATAPPVSYPSDFYDRLRARVPAPADDAP
jgi:aryl-alcohol dehydrogenase-like predicted oxidoreductase